jgi:D-alanyl-D-alanine carboxypeptidase/D-alanyl-D-alanine-endopeptidase (penicillin-binding protein 4)
VNSVKQDKTSCANRLHRITLEVTAHTQHTDVQLGGTYPANCGQSTLRRTLLPHGQYVYGVFKALWQQLGGTLSGNWMYGKTPAQAKALGTLDSVFLAEVIRHTNKFSNNVMARNLLLTLAGEFAVTPATPAKGAKVIKDWLDATGVLMPALRIDNGAGLSRDARLSAAGLATLLEKATTEPWWPEFVGSLPIATVDGSLRRRFYGIARPGRIRLKTGLLRDVRTLAGYAIDPSGNTWVVVILHNHPRAADAVGIEIQHKLLETLFQNQPREAN